ncbi:ribonuclease P protein component [Candidatus Endoriftia persephone]|uniref:Ribonuclease P protein component n=3 Tax=Gammaproteobacteria TaxID=1236 RepID=G2FGH0_9GAMM|nr:ribonuclease P protein component [Candidatus Endoriftia persephone]EGV52625.1 ribonuclease P protein component [endosymbiont of Riftia pachyptila (vent Ph05)]EGW54081.1 ribonuclease P protein component [endosymbiont of Tevnia jerichonana (vent Tica)]USF87664.1 ribonuclease P protein component [Candidatus Endoriftia persephone]
MLVLSLEADSASSTVLLALPRNCRLLKPGDFRRVFSSGKRSADVYFTVLARNNGLGRARLGLAISKKRCRRAVDRNHLKRLIRESFRESQTLLSGMDIVVLNKRFIPETRNRRYFVSLSKHWRVLIEKCGQSSPF